MNGNRLVLGTAQFGMDYGINNRRGIIAEEEISSILSFAGANNFDILDTAYAYGESEKRIGNFFRRNGASYKIISKLPGCKADEVRNILNESLERLGTTRLYGYLLHDFSSLKNDPDVWRVLEEIKREGITQKIGFSLDHPEELGFILRNDLRFDIVQFPYNLLDRRFEVYLGELKKLEVEIHTRSVFLQGLLFKSPDELSGVFEKMADKLGQLRSISKQRDISIADICLNFVKLKNAIDHIVIGIDSLDHLKQIVKSEKSLDTVSQIYGELETFREDDLRLIVPSNWKQ